MYAPHNAALSLSSSVESNDDGFDSASSSTGSSSDSCIIRGKWLYDGCNTIDEMIERLRREITLLEDLKREGWVLEHKVEDDYAYMHLMGVPEVPVESSST